MQKRNKRAGRSFHGLLSFLKVFFFSSCEKFWIQTVQTVRKLFIVFIFTLNANRGAQRAAFLNTGGGCQLQTTQTGSGRDMAVSFQLSHFSAHLEMPGGSGSQLQTAFLRMQNAAKVGEKSLIYLVESAHSHIFILFLTACLLPNYDFRVFIIMLCRVERQGGREACF